MLPMNPLPVYSLIVPSTQKELKFKPFTVKDEKCLLIAQDSEDVGVMLDTVKDVIQRCVIEVDINKLTSFDIEFIFLQIRAKSVGEYVSLIFNCDVDHGDKVEESQSRVVVNLEDVTVKYTEGHTDKISLWGDVGVKMKYPDIKTLDILRKNKNVLTDEETYTILSEYIDFIWSGDNLFYIKDIPKEELISFIDGLQSAQLKKILQFFYTIPRLYVEVKYTCPLCGLEHNKYIEGLSSFF
jgi:hypothetical protein